MGGLKLVATIKTAIDLIGGDSQVAEEKSQNRPKNVARIFWGAYIFHVE